MPPDKGPSQVVRLPPDEQIAHLTHQYETLHDRIQSVEDAQHSQSKQLDAVLGDVGELRDDMVAFRTQLRKNNSLNKKNNELLQHLATYITGQQIPGMEMPGMTADLKELKATVAKWDKWHNRAVWVSIGFTGATITTLLYYAEKIRAVYEVLVPHK